MGTHRNIHLEKQENDRRNLTSCPSEHVSKTILSGKTTLKDQLIAAQAALARHNHSFSLY